MNMPETIKKYIVVLVILLIATTLNASESASTMVERYLNVMVDGDYRTASSMWDRSVLD